MKNRTACLVGLTIASTLALDGCSSPPNDGGSSSSATSTSSSSSTGSSSSSSGEGGAGGAGGAGGNGGGVAGQGGSGNNGGNGGNGGGSMACVVPSRMDLVLAIDNSRSMADKQEILSRAVPDLVQGLVNPPCYDPAGVQPPSQPATPADMCPAGFVRAFVPLTDIHFGVISSSIGGHGADACPNIDSTTKECQPNPNTTNNDKGHLLDRADQCNLATLPTYDNKKFLAWDPGQTLTPPGEGQINDGMGGGLAPSLRNMVVGIGQIGCGYESQLESIYRFLVDPEPYATIDVVNFQAIPSGIDQVLLAQRAAFLRPDSLVTVVMLTDENDCSTKEYGQFYYSNQLRNGATPVRLPPRAKRMRDKPERSMLQIVWSSAGHLSCRSNVYRPEWWHRPRYVQRHGG